MSNTVIIVGVLLAVFYLALTIIQRMMRGMVHSASSLVWELEEMIELNEAEVLDALKPVFENTSLGLSSTDCCIEINDNSLEIINNDIEFSLKVAEGEGGRPGMILVLLNVHRDDLTPEIIYKIMGHMMAALNPPGCIHLIAPSFEQIAPYNEDLLEAMRSGDFEPMKTFFGHRWITEEEKEKEMWDLAASMARENWPEFEEAFADPQPGQEFFVRVPRNVGEKVEHIWIRLDEIKDGVFHGTLAKDSRMDVDLKANDPFEAPVEPVSDWAVIEDGKVKSGSYTAHIDTKHSLPH